MMKKTTPPDLPPTILDEFASFAAGLSFEQIPPRIVEKVSLQIMTTLSAARFSSWHKEARKILKAEQKRCPRPGTKAASVIATGDHLPPREAAIVNAAYAMSLDFDDYMLMGHMGYSAVYCALAELEVNGGTIKDLITAACAADEVMGRLSLSCFFGPLNGQMWSYIHNLGAAVSTARARGYSAEKMRDAMALALYQPNFCLAPGFWQEGCKLLTASQPLAQGMAAADYAGQGLAGAPDLIEGHLGFMHFFAFHPMKELTGELGQHWLCDTLSYKRYPGTSYIAAPVDSALAAMQELGHDHLSPEQVRRIEVSATILSHSVEAISLAGGGADKELDAVTINFSVSLSVAYALLRGDLKPSYYKENEIDRYADDIRKMAGLVTVVHDGGMSVNTFQSFEPVIDVITSMPANDRRKITSHIKTMKQGAPAVPFRLRLKAAGSLLKKLNIGRLLLGLLTRRRRPFSLADLDPENFGMKQSARCRLVLHDGRSHEVYFDIPYGAAGRGIDEQRHWVQQRWHQAFGRPASNAARLLENRSTSVKKLAAALCRAS